MSKERQPGLYPVWELMRQRSILWDLVLYNAAIIAATHCPARQMPGAEDAGLSAADG
jgi:hypothetical protein